MANKKAPDSTAPSLFSFADELDAAVRHLQNTLNGIQACIAGEIPGGEGIMYTFLDGAERYAEQIADIKDRMFEASQAAKGGARGA